MGVTVPLIAGTFYQFLIAAFVLLATSIFTGQHRLDWNVESTLAMAYAVLVTSVIAILILLWMLTHGSAAKVSSLLYLVPPMTAVQAWFLFNEKLNAQGVTGIAATALGVALVQRQRA
jgi:drug/metabolite transporter (DMT)-like permease